MTSIYDRPVRELLQTALDDLPDPFTSQDMVQWFATRYEGVNPRTVRQHLRFASERPARNGGQTLAG